MCRLCTANALLLGSVKSSSYEAVKTRRLKREKINAFTFLTCFIQQDYKSISCSKNIRRGGSEGSGVHECCCNQTLKCSRRCQKHSLYVRYWSTCRHDGSKADSHFSLSVNKHKDMFPGARRRPATPRHPTCYTSSRYNDKVLTHRSPDVSANKS